MATLATVTIPEFIIDVKMTNSRRPTYHKKGGPLPKKYQSDDFFYDSKGRLCTLDGTPIIKNAKSVDKPRYRRVNGQEFYAGVSSPHIRAKIVNAIKDNFRPYVEALPKLKSFPIQIDCQLHHAPYRADWDLDNKWIYCKVFQDLLVGTGKIPDDNIKFISKSAGIEFYPVELESQRKIVFTISTDPRSGIEFY